MIRDKSKPDAMFEMVVQQGYVPPTCLLTGQFVMMVTQRGEDACSGCNMNRDECRGRPKLLPGGAS
jgi:hypothetical protein